jgi:hypothetical protein
VISPYAKLNLIRNPFGELTRNERAALAVVDCREWVAILSQSNTAVQFLGPCGHGKTTHLLALAQALLESIPESSPESFLRAAYVYLPPSGPRPKIPRTRPLFIDEAQRLGWWERRQVFTAGGPLVLGSHEDLRPALERAGMRVVTVEVANGTTPERLVEIANRRVEASRLDAGPVPRIELPQAIELRRQHGCDIRRIEDDLYRHFQQLAEGMTPWQPVRSESS